MKKRSFGKTIAKHFLKTLALLALHVIFLGTSWADPADALFNENAVQTIRLTMAPADWQTLRDRYLENIWFPATFEWEGNRVDNVGVRSRGFASRSPIKPGLKITFSHFVRGQQFLGLTSIDLKNVVFDPTMMKNRLAKKVFQAREFVAPRIVHARVYVNGEYRGLYELQEAVNKAFLRSRFSDDRGNLYKVAIRNVFGYYFEWLGPDPGAYIPDLFKPETNETSLDPSALIGLIDAINNSTDGGFIDAVGRYIDWDTLLSFLATDNALAESDGLIGDYGTNNYYLYQFDGTTKFTLIPDDNKTNTSEPAFAIFHNADRSVLTQRAFLFPSLRTLYLRHLEEAVNQWVNATWLVPKITATRSQILQAARDDPYKPYSNEEFESAINEMIDFATTRPASLRRQVLAGRLRP